MMLIVNRIIVNMMKRNKQKIRKLIGAMFLINRIIKDNNATHVNIDIQK